MGVGDVVRSAGCPPTLCPLSFLPASECKSRWSCPGLWFSKLRSGALLGPPVQISTPVNWGLVVSFSRQSPGLVSSLWFSSKQFIVLPELEVLGTRDGVTTFLSCICTLPTWKLAESLFSEKPPWVHRWFSHHSSLPCLKPIVHTTKFGEKIVLS